MGCQQSVLSSQPYNGTNFPFTNQKKPGLPQVYNFENAEKIGDNFFKQGKYLQAIEIYQKMIQNGYTVNFDIQGLGNTDLTTSRYEWFLYRWYDETRKANKFKGNAFDALSMCFCAIRNINQNEADRGILWYEDMIAEDDRYQLKIGYANLLYNRQRYEQAIKIYNQVIQIKPKIINVYVSIALTYEYKRIQKPKAVAMANRIIEIDPLNEYAHFVIARNQPDIDVKIQKLKVISERCPQYVRVTNQIGICYGATKKEYRQAIQWYKKCTQITPQYASCYNNIGVNHELLKEYQEALVWYFRACQYDHQYKAAHVNVSDIFDVLKYTKDDIYREMLKYPKLDKFYFFYYLGLAYYDKKESKVSIQWFEKAMEINPNNHKLMNSIGISYDELHDFANSQKYYLRSIELNTKYFSAYYNLAIVYKGQNNIEKAIQWYKKAVQVNPRYSYAYNNLGNIYKNRGEYQKAVDCYQKAVNNLSTYTLAYANLGICQLQLEQYQQAFHAFTRAKELLPTDNNGLTQANKVFLGDNIQLFDKEGQKWKKTGSINQEQKQALQKLIKSFQSNFNNLYSGGSFNKVPDQKALKPQILQIVKIIAEQDKFQLNSFGKIFQIIKLVFHDDQEYFHIVPQMFIQYFWNNTFKKNKPILEVQEKIAAIIKEISKKQAGLTQEGSTSQAVPSLDIKMKNFNPSNDYPVNLFKDTVYFKNYQVLYSEIHRVNQQAEKSLSEFIEFVEAVRKRSNGIPYGVNMKIPKRQDQQFKVVLRILEKMFRKELNQEKVKQIIEKIDKQLKSSKGKITLLNIVHEIMDVWTKQITSILEQRLQNQTQTICGISDLVRGKIMFDNLQDLAKAIEACDKLCNQRKYKILELDNRLTKPQTRDVVLKIKIKEAVCEFQLAMRQDQSKYHLIHSIYEIQRSPLGCIFGSYLFMSKGFTYPFLANCKDIVSRLQKNTNDLSRSAVESARYIVNFLEQ